MYEVLLTKKIFPNYKLDEETEFTSFHKRLKLNSDFFRKGVRMSGIKNLMRPEKSQHVTFTDI